MKIYSVFLIWVLSLGLLCSAADVPVFNFYDGAVTVNETLPEAKRGIKLVPAVDGTNGLKVLFSAYAPGNATWPYVSTKPGALSITDWSKFKSVKFKVRNHNDTALPRLSFTIRDHKNKYVVIDVAVPAKATREFTVPLAPHAGKIALDKIAKVDFALSKPAAPAAVELMTVTLSQDAPAAGAAAKKSNPERMVSRIHDLRGEFFKPRQGLQRYGSATITAPRIDAVDISNKPYVKGQQNPNIVLAAADDGTFNNGDFGYMTHIAYEFEARKGFGNYIGMTLADHANRTMWIGIGTPAAGAPARGLQQLYATGLTMDQLAKITISCSTPTNAHTYRVKKFQFEFRPEVLKAATEKQFAIVARQALNAAEKTELDTLRRQLNRAYEAVRHNTFKYRDAIAFNQTAAATRDAALALLRRHNLRALPAATAQTFGVGVADSMTSVFLEGPGSEIRPATEFTLEMAGNESESFQAVIVAPADGAGLKNVKVEVEPLKNAAGNTLAAEAAVVGFAKTSRLTYVQEYVGFYPDFIISYQQSCAVAPGETVPFWVRLTAGKNAAPGLYQGMVNVTADGQKPYRFPITVKVYDFSLPDGTVLPSAWHINDWYLLRYFHVNQDPEKSRKMAYDFIDLNARYRIPYDQIYWDATTKDYRRDYFEKIKYMNEKHTLKSFSLMTVNLPDRWILDPNDPKIDASIANVIAALDKWVPLCKEFGILDKAYIYGFDEGRMDAVTQKYYDAIHAKYPDIPIMTTARYGDPQLPAVKNLDIWVPIATRFINRPETVAANRAAGKQVWWYLCDFPRPPEPSFMLDVPAATPRVFMGLMTAKYQPDGFLYWANIYWRDSSDKAKSPIVQDGPRTAWNPVTCNDADTEEGNLFCPGRDNTVLPTIRVENYRDGVEDHWYFELLKRAAADCSDAKLKRDAAAALNIPPELVNGSSNYVTDPLPIRAKRRAVGEVLEKIMQKKAKN